MKDIRIKDTHKCLHTLEKTTDLASKMKRGLIRSKDQFRNLSDDGHITPDEYAQDNAKYISERVLQGSKETVKNTYKGGKKLVRDIKQKKRGADSIKRTAKSTGKQTFKTMKQSIKTAEKTSKNAARTAKQTAKAAQKTAKASAKAAKKSAEAAKYTAKAAAKTAKLAVKATITAIKGIAAAIKSLAAAIAAGGWVAVVVILVICVVGLIVGSCYGIFFSDEDGTEGTPLSEVVATLNSEFETKITDIQNTTTYNDFEIESNDGVTSINWEDVLAVFSVKTTTGDDAQNVACLTDEKIDALRDVMFDMNSISHSTQTVTKTVSVTSTDTGGNETVENKSITRTVLTVTITHKSYTDMISEYSFDREQKEQLELLKDEEYATLWGELLGGYSRGSSEILSGDSNRTPNNIFSWPLQEAGSINSTFGYRTDPISGEVSYHGGVDIGAANGRPILAAADGKVTIANSTDSWGGSYGYYVKIKHNETFETLYAHCSKICVTCGQQVKKGQVIGYVGSTGRSTGNHLHFEVRKDGVRTNALDYFN